jgi:hypothetical protein
MSQAPSTPARYPKRKRVTVVYAEPSDDEGLDLDVLSDTDNDEPEFGSSKKVFPH